MGDNEKPDKVINVCGREFRLFKYYDDVLEKKLLNLPDFAEYPEYTDDGNPFVLAIEESCQNWKPYAVNDSAPGDCSGCGWFYLEHPTDSIGVCMCVSLKRPDSTLNQKEGKQKKYQIF